MAVLLAAFPTAPLGAQSAFVPRSGFGGDLQTLTLPHYAFLPHNAAQEASARAAPTTRIATRPAARLSSSRLWIRAGCPMARSSNASTSSFATMTRPPMPRSRPISAVSGSRTTGPTSTVTARCRQRRRARRGTRCFRSPLDHTIRYDDFDGDGGGEFVGYILAIQFGINATPNYDTALRLRGARILDRRQVTPAPSSATFLDVPTSHPYFQFVEALAASGITAGCGTGILNRPDSPLTRGQMAVFLAKALGLHWPATAP